MQKETLEAIDDAVKAAIAGESYTLTCYSKSVAKDVNYRIRRALRKIRWRVSVATVNIMIAHPKRNTSVEILR